MVGTRPRERFAMPATAVDHAALSQACGTLWLATLSLMTAFMQAPAAHRLLLARRIARNFDTLQSQDCFSPRTRASFARLARRWQRRADRLSPAGEAAGGVFGRLQRLIAR
jgi:hypothetical protein